MEARWVGRINMGNGGKGIRAVLRVFKVEKRPNIIDLPIRRE